MGRIVLVPVIPEKEHVFCVDCKHSSGGNFIFTWWKRWTKSNDLLCTRNTADNSKIDIVSGKIIKSSTRPTDCGQSRDSNYGCGVNGVYWVPYKKKHLLAYLKRSGNEGESK